MKRLPNLNLILPPKQFLNLNFEESKKEYFEILDTLLYLHQKIIESKKTFELFDVHSDTLMTKFFFHSYSFYNLIDGYKFHSKYYPDLNEIKVTDIYTSLVVIRAQFETYLMYLHIYVNSRNDDELKLRWFAWMYSSILSRQKYPTDSVFAIKQKEHDAESLSNMATDMKKLTSFNKLSEKQKISLLTSGKGQNGRLFKSWNDIMEESGYLENHFFRNWYSFLSGHSHSEGTSILQIRNDGLVQATTAELSKTYLWVAKYVVCSMLMTIKERYKIVEIMYNPLPQQLRQTVELYAACADTNRKKPK